jgi:HPt (histidine-containing phosphotransfer) domain-containing protein
VNSPLNTPLPTDDTGHPPVLDDDALAALLDSLEGNEGALDAFVVGFIAHWPERLRRAEEAIALRESAAIINSALSIKVAAQMVGAVRLSDLGIELERLVRGHRLDGVPAVVGRLRTTGSETVAALRSARSRLVRVHAV